MTLALQVAFLTGQSDPTRCALSPVQHAFLDALPVPTAAKIRRNFPYAADPGEHRDVSLVTAGWHNARQYLASRSASFAERHRPATLQLIARAERTVLLAGSCGLELLTNLRLPESALRRVHVFAYGAVARRSPICAMLSVRGRRDWMARVGGMTTDVNVDCDHLTYLETPEVLELCKKFLADVANVADQER